MHIRGSNLEESARENSDVQEMLTFLFSNAQDGRTFPLTSKNNMGYVHFFSAMIEGILLFKLAFTSFFYQINIAISLYFSTIEQYRNYNFNKQM